MVVASLAVAANLIDRRVFVLMMSICFLLLSLIMIDQEQGRGGNGNIGIWMVLTVVSVCGTVASALSLVTR